MRVCICICIFVCNTTLPPSFCSVKVLIAVQPSLPYITQCTTVFINNLINNNTSVLIMLVIIVIAIIIINVLIVSKIAGPAVLVDRASSTNNLQKMQVSILHMSMLDMYHHDSHDQIMAIHKTPEMHEITHLMHNAHGITVITSSHGMIAYTHLWRSVKYQCGQLLRLRTSPAVILQSSSFM